jgi:hypothetical protein
MTLKEANRVLAETDCGDTDAVAVALTARARAIVEFAAVAPRGLLVETLDAGEEFRGRLEHAHVEVHRDLDRLTKLTRGLASTVDQRRPHCVRCFG